MQEDTQTASLDTLKAQLERWQFQIAALELEDRDRFVTWLQETMTPQQFALIVDGEILRAALWEIYLRDRYGA
jgi:hypothetical protein